MISWVQATWAFAIHELLMLTFIPIVLLRRKEPSATLAWIFAILLMPIVGVVAFLLFGNERLARRANKRGERKRRYKGKAPHLDNYLATAQVVSTHPRIARLLEHINPYEAVLGNQVDLLTDMHENYRLQLQAIAEAKDHVHIQYYIFEPDRSGERFCQALIAAAKRGVHVRFLYDAVGSLGLSRRYLRRLEAAGIQTACFIPVTFWTRRWIFNFRNHRKILVVDGRIGFTGGANIGDEYLGEADIPVWRDMHLRVTGPAVFHLQRVFAEDWAFASGKELTQPYFFPTLEPTGDMAVQVVPGGPDLEVAIYHELFFAAIVQAERSVTIITPYFVPSEAITLALQTTARRGVKVQIVVPGVDTHRFVRWASQSYYEELLEAGVRLYEYRGGFLHAKVLTVDNRWTVIGTANVDNRSMRLNFEVGMVLYDLRATRQVNEWFATLLDESVPIHLRDWRQRSLFSRVVQNSLRLFSPIL